jgi:ABC-2 type transport system permease protein
VSAPAVRDPAASALGVRQLATLVWTLALTDFRLRFYGSALGVLWTLVRPFAFFSVIYVVFTEVAKLDASVENYGVYILFALVLFTFFAEVTQSSVKSLVSRENLLRKMAFEPIVIPLAVATTALMNLAVTLVAVLIFAMVNGVLPTWTWLELPVIIVLLTMFALGVGMLLSVLYVRFRDVDPIWDVISQVLFYASCVLYVATTVPVNLQAEFLVNPIAALFTQMRHAVIDQDAPTVAALMNSEVRVLIPLGIILGTFALGVWFFRRESPRVAENL